MSTPSANVTNSTLKKSGNNTANNELRWMWNTKLSKVAIKKPVNITNANKREVPRTPSPLTVSSGGGRKSRKTRKSRQTRKRDGRKRNTRK